MRFDVELGGVTSAWNYAGSLTLQNWLEGRPWQKAGGFCVVRTETASRDIAFRAIRRAAHAIHSDDGMFSVKLIECGGDAGTPKSALMRHFQLTRNPMEVAETLRLRLRDTMQLLVFAEQEPVDVDEWERFIALAEHLSKSAATVPLAITVLDVRSILSHEPTCSFHAGHIDLQVLAGASALDDAAIWAKYVYQRVWWDTGGCLERAYALSRRCADVPVGDDEGLEDALQAYALETMHGHAAWPKLKSIHDKASVAKTSARSYLEAEAELLEARLLWRPPGLQSLRLVPFVSRALLAERTLADASRWSLRSALVCSPLVSECLGVCQFLETQIRARLHGRDNQSKLPADVGRRLKEFQDGGSEFVRYPISHPAPPKHQNDILAFASFGETLNSCPPGAVSDPYRRVQHLRNCLAHGHYVTWWHCKLALQLLRSLDTKQSAHAF
ncbi:hypothetical protein [Paraburkholderia tropica]|uniref:hypothetical protein n=1 Tax=Paraburkholderia tropica TaxID=92647 RepID=UPI002ABE482A|nr:hypothetical protein [Paraburkholderia tropica]